MKVRKSVEQFFEDDLRFELRKRRIGCYLC